MPNYKSSYCGRPRLGGGEMNEEDGKNPRLNQLESWINITSTYMETFAFRYETLNSRIILGKSF